MNTWARVRSIIIPVDMERRNCGFVARARHWIQPYCAVIGGSETYGKFVERPYPDLLQDMTGFPVVNLGCANAGADVFALDETVMDICKNAEITVIQLTGAQNISNRYYSVHPRRTIININTSKNK